MNVLIQRIAEAVVGAFERWIHRPPEVRIGGALLAAGLITVTIAGAFRTEASIEFNIGVLSGTITVGSADGGVLLAFGIVSSALGAFLLFRSMLSPSAIRREGMIRLTDALMAHTEGASGLAVQANFQKAFGYSASLPMIKVIATSDDPEQLAGSLKFAKLLVSVTDGRFVPSKDNWKYYQAIWTLAYWPVAVVVIGSYSAIHFPFFGGTPDTAIPPLWALFALAATAQVWVLTEIRKYSSVERLVER